MYLYLNKQLLKLRSDSMVQYLLNPCSYKLNILTTCIQTNSVLTGMFMSPQSWHTSILNKKNGCFQTAMRLNGAFEKTKSQCLTLCSELPRHKSLELKIKCYSMKSNTSYKISLPRPNYLSYATHTQFISPYFHTMSTIVSFCAF